MRVLSVRVSLVPVTNYPDSQHGSCMSTGQRSHCCHYCHFRECGAGDRNAGDCLHVLQSWALLLFQESCAAQYWSTVLVAGGCSSSCLPVPVSILSEDVVVLTTSPSCTCLLGIQRSSWRVSTGQRSHRCLCYHF